VFYNSWRSRLLHVWGAGTSQFPDRLLNTTEDWGCTSQGEAAAYQNEAEVFMALVEAAVYHWEDVGLHNFWWRCLPTTVRGLVNLRTGCCTPL
jgi:hypothetical protein